MNPVPGLVLCLLTLGFVPLVMTGSPLAVTTSTPVITSTTKTDTTATTPDICSNALCQSPNPQNKTFDPSKVPNYFGTDIGKFDVQTAKDGFKWATAPQDSLTMGIPTVGSPVPNDKVYYNSTHTAYKLAGPFGTLDVFFKQAQYSVKISIHSNLNSPQSVCLPFTSPNPIVQQSFTNQTTQKTTLFPSVKAGDEIFDWGDILIDNPTWNSVNNSLCLSLLSGITNIDPLALDGSGHNGCGNAVSCTVTLTTTTFPDVIILAITDNCNVSLCDPTSNVVVTDVSGLSWTQRAVERRSQSNIIFEYCAIDSVGTLAADVITATDVTHPNSYWALVAYGVSGANTAGCTGGNSYDANGALPAHTNGISTNLQTTYSTSTANDFILAIAGDTYNWATITEISGFTNIAKDTSSGSARINTEYRIVSATQSGASCGWTIDNTNGWAIICDAIKQAAVTNQPVVIVLKVNPSPSPDGGGIVQCVGLSCNWGNIPPVSSTSSITIGTTSSTFIIIAGPFSGYIWNGWSGATTYVADTINPTQTLSITSFATTTQSSTLTANFLAATAPAQSNFAAFAIIGIVLGFMLIAIMVARRR